MEFKDQINYLEFWESGFESINDNIEQDSIDLNPVKIREPSPDVFIDSSSDEEKTDLDTKKAAVLNQIILMMKTEQDGVRFFIMDSIRKLLTTSSSSTSRELFYKCPINVGIDVFYRKVSLLFDIRCLESMLRLLQLHRIFNLLNVLPIDLRIFSSPKGLVAGDLKITFENGEVIQCLQSVASVIPTQVGNVKVETGAEAIILVEKDTVFKKLLEQQIFKKLKNFILLTGKGYPDINTRLLLKRLLDHKKMKVYCLVDGDPYGIHIMTVYRYGSKALDHVKEQISCPEIKWIGITPSEMQQLKLPMIPLTEFDKITLNTLLKNDNIEKKIKDELLIQKGLNAKTEIEYLSFPPLNYNLTDYIAEKISHGLFI